MMAEGQTLAGPAAGVGMPSLGPPGAILGGDGARGGSNVAPLNFAWARALETYVETTSQPAARGADAAPPRQAGGAGKAGLDGRLYGGSDVEAPLRGSDAGPKEEREGDKTQAASGVPGEELLDPESLLSPEDALLEQHVLAHLRRLMESSALRQRQQSKQQGEGGRPADIPVFFKKKPESDSLSARAHLCAKYKFLQKQRRGLLDQQELEVIWMCLREHRTTPDDESGAERINYDDFTQAAAACAQKVGPKSRRFFTAATFLTFEADDSGRIAILPFYLYIMRWVSITQTRIDMCLLDKDNDGFLTPEEMEQYIQGLVPSLKLLRDMDPEFLPLYCKIATRKFLFFCDPQRRGKLLIREVLLSPVLSELMELRQEPEGEEQQAALQENWFALVPSRRMYEMFVALDVDQSGGLSKPELRAFNDDNLTDIFIERVFDLHVRRIRPRSDSAAPFGTGGKPGEMDLGSFLDLVLALDNKHTPEGLAYIVKCLDLNERGYLTNGDIYTHFRPVQKGWMEGGNIIQSGWLKTFKMRFSM